MSASTKYRAPARVRPGTEISVVAPAGSFAPEALDRGLAAARALSFAAPAYDTQPGAHRYFAAPTATRVAELQAATGAVTWAARGGSGAAQVAAALPEDFVLPGWLVGFSDITTLHARQQARGMCSVHGANLTTLPSWTPGAQRELAAILLGDIRQQRFSGLPLIAGRASGPLLGGNLTVLASLVGCGILPDFGGSIVLLEDVGEAPYRLERALYQLLLSDTFARVRGFVLGQMTRCGTDDELGPLATFAELLAPLGVPVLAGLPLGHGPTSRAVVLGGSATLDGEGAQLEVTW